MAKKKVVVSSKDNTKEVQRRVTRVYDLIRKRLERSSFSFQKAAVLPGVGEEYQKVEEEYDVLSDEVRKEVDALETRLNQEKGLDGLRVRKQELRAQVQEKFKRLEDKFKRLQIRAVAGKDPEKIIDQLLALAEEVGIIDPLPPATDPDSERWEKERQELKDENGVPL